LFYVVVGGSTWFACFWLLLGLVSWFCLFLGMGVVVVVDVVSTTFGVELFCLVVVVTRFRVHNTFAGIEWVIGFLV
jgi:hypothetical protein